MGHDQFSSLGEGSFIQGLPVPQEPVSSEKGEKQKFTEKLSGKAGDVAHKADKVLKEVSHIRSELSHLEKKITIEGGGDLVQWEIDRVKGSINDLEGKIHTLEQQLAHLPESGTAHEEARASLTTLRKEAALLKTSLSRLEKLSTNENYKAAVACRKRVFFNCNEARKDTTIGAACLTKAREAINNLQDDPDPSIQREINQLKQEVNETLLATALKIFDSGEVKEPKDLATLKKIVEESQTHLGRELPIPPKRGFSLFLHRNVRKGARSVERIAGKITKQQAVAERLLSERAKTGQVRGMQLNGLKGEVKKLKEELATQKSYLAQRKRSGSAEEAQNKVVELEGQIRTLEDKISLLESLSTKEYIVEENTLNRLQNDLNEAVKLERRDPAQAAQKLKNIYQEISAAKERIAGFKDETGKEFLENQLKFLELGFNLKGKACLEPSEYEAKAFDMLVKEGFVEGKDFERALAYIAKACVSEHLKPEDAQGKNSRLDQALLMLEKAEDQGVEIPQAVRALIFSYKLDTKFETRRELIEICKTIQKGAKELREAQEEMGGFHLGKTSEKIRGQAYTFQAMHDALEKLKAEEKKQPQLASVVRAAVSVMQQEMKALQNGPHFLELSSDKEKLREKLLDGAVTFNSASKDYAHEIERASIVVSTLMAQALFSPSQETREAAQKDVSAILDRLPEEHRTKVLEEVRKDHLTLFDDFLKNMVRSLPISAQISLATVSIGPDQKTEAIQAARELYNAQVGNAPKWAKPFLEGQSWRAGIPSLDGTKTPEQLQNEALRHAPTLQALQERIASLEGHKNEKTEAPEFAKLQKELDDLKQEFDELGNAELDNQVDAMQKRLDAMKNDPNFMKLTDDKQARYTRLLANPEKISQEDPRRVGIILGKELVRATFGKARATFGKATEIEKANLHIFLTSILNSPNSAEILTSEIISALRPYLKMRLEQVTSGQVTEAEKNNFDTLFEKLQSLKQTEEMLEADDLQKPLQKYLEQHVPAFSSIAAQIQSAAASDDPEQIQAMFQSVQPQSPDYILKELLSSKEAQPFKASIIAWKARAQEELVARQEEQLEPIRAKMLANQENQKSIQELQTLANKINSLQEPLSDQQAVELEQALIDFETKYAAFMKDFSNTEKLALQPEHLGLTDKAGAKTRLHRSDWGFKKTTEAQKQALESLKDIKKITDKEELKRALENLHSQAKEGVPKTYSLFNLIEKDEVDSTTYALWLMALSSGPHLNWDPADVTVESAVNMVEKSNPQAFPVVKELLLDYKVRPKNKSVASLEAETRSLIGNALRDVMRAKESAQAFTKTATHLALDTNTSERLNTANERLQQSAEKFQKALEGSLGKNREAILKYFEEAARLTKEGAPREQIDASILKAQQLAKLPETNVDGGVSAFHDACIDYFNHLADFASIVIEIDKKMPADSANKKTVNEAQLSMMQFCTGSLPKQVEGLLNNAPEGATRREQLLPVNQKINEKLAEMNRAVGSPK